jgi:alpha-tubulin suppressor-like RCC1 family protein
VNCEGGLGTGLAIDCQTPEAPAPVLNVNNAVQLSGGDEHNCVVRTDGTASCWGWNVYGADGNDSTADQATPVAVLGLTGVSRMAAGRTHTCAVLTNGQVSCWGDNYFGMLGNGTVGGYNLTPTIVSGISDAVDAQASEGDTCVLRRSGGVTCFGWHAKMWTGAGDYSTYSGVPTNMNGITDAVAIGLGHDHICVVHAGTGTVSCWGNNSDGQLGTGVYGCGDGTYDCPSPGKVISGLSGVTQLSGSYVHTCAAQTSGQEVCFGWLATVDATGAYTRADFLSPTPVSGLTDVVQVSTNEVTDDTDCAVRKSGQIVCWGQNSVGLLGVGVPSTATPTPVPGQP